MSVSICELLRSAPDSVFESDMAFPVYSTNTSITGWFQFAGREGKGEETVRDR